MSLKGRPAACQRATEAAQSLLGSSHRMNEVAHSPELMQLFGLGLADPGGGTQFGHRPAHLGDSSRNYTPTPKPSLALGSTAQGSRLSATCAQRDGNIRDY